MKIGILTFSYSYNIGAMLQSYALQETIREMGHDAQIINYVPAGYKLPFWRGWGWRTLDQTRIKKRLAEVLISPWAKRSIDGFRYKHLALSARYSNYDDVAAIIKSYDTIVVGSDQVWNANLIRPDDADRVRLYTLEFPDYRGVRISYAACCGTATQPPLFDQQMSPRIQHLDFVGVRNDITRDRLMTAGIENAVVQSDPTLLHHFENPPLHHTIKHRVPYILFYGLTYPNAPCHEGRVRRVRAAIGDLPTVAVLPIAHRVEVPRWPDQKIWKVSPMEWVSLIKNAAFVYTDSFHAVLFAARYGVPMLAYCGEEWRRPRLEDCQERYGLKNIVSDTVCDAAAVTEQDWELVTSRIDAEVSVSRDTLRHALGLVGE